MVDYYARLKKKIIQYRTTSYLGKLWENLCRLCSDKHWKAEVAYLKKC